MMETWSQGSREPLKMILRPLSLGSVDTGSISLGSPNLSLTPPLGHLLEIGGGRGFGRQDCSRRAPRARLPQSCVATHSYGGGMREGKPT
jgi:hypothetical protein